tara:strand:- start:220 stop:750 length:531 start_codon:yes stop_codon:yes gene_type:complete
MLLSLDVSTSCTGYCVFDQDELKDIGYIDLSKHKDFYKKVAYVKAEITKITKRFNITHVGIEENLQAFRPGLSSAKTLMTLAQFNGTVRWLCYEMLNIDITSINVNAARKIVGLKINRKSSMTTKEQVLSWVKLQENISWPTKVLKSGPSKGKIRELSACYDMADAYVIGRAYNKT